MKVKVRLSIGYVGAVRKAVLDVDDDLTDDELDEIVRDWAHNYIEWGFERVDAADEDDK